MHNSKKNISNKFTKKETNTHTHKDKQIRGSKKHTLVEYYRKRWAGESSRAAAESKMGHIIPNSFSGERRKCQKGRVDELLTSTEAPIILSVGKIITVKRLHLCSNASKSINEQEKF